MFLYQAIQQVLQQKGNVPMSTEDIADEINRQGLYRKRNGAPVDPWPVALRAASDVDKGSPPIFDVLIRLR